MHLLRTSKRESFSLNPLSRKNSHLSRMNSMVRNRSRLTSALPVQQRKTDGRVKGERERVDPLDHSKRTAGESGRKQPHRQLNDRFDRSAPDLQSIRASAEIPVLGERIFDVFLFLHQQRHEPCGALRLVALRPRRRVRLRLVSFLDQRVKCHSASFEGAHGCAEKQKDNSFFVDASS